MGELEGHKGWWAYPEGGMGAVSEAIAKSAQSHGVDIFTDKVNNVIQLYIYLLKSKAMNKERYKFI